MIDERGEALGGGEELVRRKEVCTKSAELVQTSESVIYVRCEVAVEHATEQQLRQAVQQPCHIPSLRSVC